MPSSPRNPSWQWQTILLCGLSLSIGWGIRGNFGHEYGAMIPGALTALAVCLLSGRKDWHERAAYFAFFGAVGWGFGGSISYMQVISYTHSGHLPTQVWGFGGLFLIGALWAGLGGAGTALPAVAERSWLTNLFKPLLWIFATWWVWTVVGESIVDSMSDGADDRWNRHKYPLYWFDADWTKAVTALIGVALYELCHERVAAMAGWAKKTFVALAIVFGLSQVFGAEFEGIGTLYVYLVVIATVVWLFDGLRQYRARGTWVSAMLAGVGTLAVLAELYILDAIPVPLAVPLMILVPLVAFEVTGGRSARGALLPVYAAAGALGGFLVQGIFRLIGLERPLAEWLTHYQGDVTLFERAQILGVDSTNFTFQQRHLLEQYAGNLGQFKEDLYTNWPAFLVDHPTNYLHIGWVLGALVALGVFFARHGKFRDGSGLFWSMALGWLAGFMLFPVLLDIRLTPPRSDDWSGILGVYVGALVYLVRHQFGPVAYASLASATIGGVGFSGIALLKLAMVRPGNPMIETNPGTIEAWSHWQHSNWHSFLEQSYGFVNGIAIAIALALISGRVWKARGERESYRWTEAVAAGFVLLFLVFVNWRKNVGTWIDQDAVPAMMKMPWLESVELSAHQWYFLVFWAIGTAVIVAMVRHLREPLPMVPDTGLGKGQLLYVVFLWTVCIFNFERALTGFHESRLLTEGTIFVNAALATILLVLYARDTGSAHVPRMARPTPWATAALTLVLVFVVTVTLETFAVRALYGDHHAGHAGRGIEGIYVPQTRFGPDAEWRVHPLLKSAEHN